MRSVRPALAAGTVAAFFVAEYSTLSQASPNQGPSSELQGALVRRLIGLTVENHDGQKLGTIRNFVMDLRSGQARYVIISSGGVVGIGSRSKVVPAQAVSTATAKKGIASLDISKYRWAKAPAFNKKNDLTLLNDAAWSKRVAHFYSQPKPGASLGPATALTPRETGETRPVAPSTGSLQLAGNVIGQQVINRQQEKIGEVSDLLVDLAGQKPAFVIISAAKLLNKEQNFAVPLRSLSPAAKDKLMLDANRNAFEQAQRFDERIWQSAGSSSNTSAIYRFARK